MGQDERLARVDENRKEKWHIPSKQHCSSY